MAKLSLSPGPDRQAMLDGMDRALQTLYFERGRRLAVSVLWHGLGLVLGTIEIYLVVRLLGLPISPLAAFAIGALGTAVKFFSFMVPASLGALEGGNVAIFAAFGLGGAVGLTYSLVRRLREIVWIAAGFLASHLVSSPPGSPRIDAERTAPTASPAPASQAGMAPRRRLPLLRLELVDELLERGGLDDLVELGAVVGDEAHALDIDVVDEPPGPLLEQSVVDRNLGAALGRDAGGDRGGIAVDALVGVRDLFSAVELDLGDVRSLEQVGEQRRELLALLVGEGCQCRASDRRATSGKSKISWAIFVTATRRSSVRSGPFRAGSSRILTTRSMVSLSCSLTGPASACPAAKIATTQASAIAHARTAIIGRTCRSPLIGHSHARVLDEPLGDIVDLTAATALALVDIERDRVDLWPAPPVAARSHSGPAAHGPPSAASDHRRY